MASTGSTSLSKRVARRNCFKSRIFQLNGNTNYGDNPKNRRAALRAISGGIEDSAAA